LQHCECTRCHACSKATVQASPAGRQVRFCTSRAGAQYAGDKALPSDSTRVRSQLQHLIGKIPVVKCTVRITGL
jgi:hypothetical protein